MARSKVAILRTTPESVKADYARLMDLADYKKHLPADSTVMLKDNISWHFPYLSANSTPWQLDAVIEKLKGDGYRDLVCVQNRTVVTNAEKGERLNKFTPILKKHAIPALFNFRPDHMKWVVLEPKDKMLALDKVFPEGIRVPDYFIGRSVLHLPTVKCHIYTTTTGAMKNAFGGLLNTRRHYTHTWIHETLVDLLSIQKQIHKGVFCVMDGTIAGDGPGPRTMRPVEKDVILASDDQVAIDAVAAKLMGFDPMAIPFIRMAHERGLGVGRFDEIEIVGDVDAAKESWGFSVGDNLASRVGDLLWFSPLKVLQKLFFHTPLVNLFVFGSFFYHDYYWWPVKGKRRMEEFQRQKRWVASSPNIRSEPTLPRLLQWLRLIGSLVVWSVRGFRRDAMPRGLPRLLGEMKGLPQKLGQFLAYTSRSLDDFSFLQVAGVPLAPQATRAAFGARLARFDSAEMVPISAASVCQVHRARIGDESVVVKLLYPGIERALALDFRVARTSLKLIALPLPRVLADPLRRGRHYLGVLESEMRGECDLPREAATLAAFANFLASTTFPEARFLAVPELRRDRSDARALVLSFAEGEPADQFLRRLPRLRNRFRDLLFAFHRHTLFELGQLHADPHPGNFLCREVAGELHVTIVDFGCAKNFAPPLRAAFVALIDAVAAWDDAAVRANALALGFLAADLDALGIQLQLFLEVILAPFLAARRGADFDWDEWRLEYKLNMLASSRSATYAFTLPDPLLLLLRVLAAFARYR